MPQTKEQRRYWAVKRQNERAQLREDTKHIKHWGGPITLHAGSLQELADIRRLHPDVEVHLDEAAIQQTQLFDTGGLRE